MAKQTKARVGGQGMRDVIRRQWPVLLLALLIVLPYARTLEVPFLFDDPGAITENPYLKNPGTGEWIWKTPDNTTFSGRPVVQWTFAANSAVTGMEPAGMRMVNVAIHVLSALVLWHLLGRIPVPGSSSPVPFWLAWGTAWLWAVHPLHTQAVTYLAQRTESLMGFFYLLTLWASWRGWESRRWRVVAVVACALGMGTKEAMVSAPLAVVLLDWCATRHPARELWRRRGWFYLALCAGWLILMLCLGTSTVVDLHAQNPLRPMEYLMIQAEVITHYLRLAAWPYPLVFDYYDWPVPRWNPGLVLKFVFLGGLFLCGLVGVLRRKLWAVPLFCFFAVLAPTSSVLPLWDPAVEYRMYLPLAGCMALAMAAGIQVGKAAGFFPRFAPAAWGLPASVALVFSVMTAARNQDYATAETIWADTVDKRPLNPRAWQNLGQARVKAGRVEAGLADMEKALQLSYRPGLAPAAHYNLASIYFDHKRIIQARDHFDHALRLQPDYPKALANRALVHAQMGEYERAAADQKKALASLGSDPVLHVQHALVLEKIGDYPGAWAHLQTAQKLGHAVPDKLARRIRAQF